jgi:hypothetical protein
MTAQVRYLTAASKEGWTDAIRTRDQARIVLPGYVKVNYLKTATVNNVQRDFFIPFEGLHKNTECSVRRKDDGSTYLVNGFIPGEAVIIVNPTKAHLWYGTGSSRVGPIFTQIDTENPIPEGTYEFGIPDEPHRKYGDQYLNDTQYANVWYPIPFDKDKDGKDDERYLHCGRISDGCVTVRDFNAWTKLYNYLYNRRRKDGIVGTITINNSFS